MAPLEPRWEHFAHGADVGIRGRAGSLAGAFEQVALALTGVITEPTRVSPRMALTVECRSNDYEELLFDWINAIVYEMSTRRMLFGRFRVQVDGLRLRAEIEGEPVDRARHDPAVEVKGATYTAARVFQDPDSKDWVAECVVDV